MSRPTPSSADAYDEVPYRDAPIEWAAPERLALISLLHGGPRPPLRPHRVLELGCANGGNLIGLAYYRRHGRYLGIDGSARQIATGQARIDALGLPNIELRHADFLDPDLPDRIEGELDFILVHGVISWVSDEARDAVLRLCAERLAPEGLLYLNYNALPGWNVRGMVRDFVLGQTRGDGDLMAQARRVQEVCATMAGLFDGAEGHPYSKLMANEMRLVCDQEITYVIHEYLEQHNRPYWRSEFEALARSHGLAVVADADFNLDSGRVDPEIGPWLSKEGIVGTAIEDTIDLLIYRQLCSPILAREGWTPRPATVEEIGALFVASPLRPCEAAPGETSRFRHPRGNEITAEPSMRDALLQLGPQWPRGRRVREVVDDVAEAVDDLRLLHRHGLVDLRLVEPEDFDGRVAEGTSGGLNALNELEAREGGKITTPYHTWVDAPGQGHDR